MRSNIRSQLLPSKVINGKHVKADTATEPADEFPCPDLADKTTQYTTHTAYLALSSHSSLIYAEDLSNVSIYLPFYLSDLLDLSIRSIYWIYQSDLSIGSVYRTYLSICIYRWVHGTMMNYVYTHIIYRVYEYSLFTLLAVQLSY